MSSIPRTRRLGVSPALRADRTRTSSTCFGPGPEPFASSAVPRLATLLDTSLCHVEIAAGVPLVRLPVGGGSQWASLHPEAGKHAAAKAT